MVFWLVGDDTVGGWDIEIKLGNKFKIYLEIKAAVFSNRITFWARVALYLTIKSSDFDNDH